MSQYQLSDWVRVKKQRDYQWVLISLKHVSLMWSFGNGCMCVCVCSPEECQEECKFSTVCLLEHGRARCSCEPIRCDGTYTPVCGNDGHTYPNDCERRRAECLTQTTIRIKQQGPCGKWKIRPLILMEVCLFDENCCIGVYMCVCVFCLISECIFSCYVCPSVFVLNVTVQA